MLWLAHGLPREILMALTIFINQEIPVPHTTFPLETQSPEGPQHPGVSTQNFAEAWVKSALLFQVFLVRVSSPGVIVAPLRSWWNTKEVSGDIQDVPWVAN